MNSDNVPFNITIFHLEFEQKNDKYTFSVGITDPGQKPTPPSAWEQAAAR